MAVDNLPDIIWIFCVRETLVVNDDIIIFSPFRIVVELDLRLSSPSSLIDDRPLDVGLGRG